MMICVQEADRLLQAHVRLRPARTCELEQAAGEVLREEIRADRPMPPFDRVAMDGVALCAAAVGQGTRRFRVQRTQQAGAEPGAAVLAGACIEVMTGAVLPAGCDCVVKLEELDLADGWAELRGPSPRCFQNVHLCGSDRPAGAVLMSAGTVLDAPLLAVAASVGRATLQVTSRPRIAIASTGDELVPVADTPAAHQIRASNATAIAAALHARGFTDITTAAFTDDPDRLRAGLGDLLAEHDVLVVSGGVSMGHYDYVPDTLRTLGVSPHFHRLRQKPGKPLWFGTIGDDEKLVFGLPGNPVSALVCACRYLIPTLQRMCGGAPRQRTVRLAEPARRPEGVTYFAAVRLQERDGCTLARPVPANGSGDLAALIGTDGFIEIPAESPAEAGTPVPYWSWA